MKGTGRHVATKLGLDHGRVLRLHLALHALAALVQGSPVVADELAYLSASDAYGARILGGGGSGHDAVFPRVDASGDRPLSVGPCSYSSVKL